MAPARMDARTPRSPEHIEHSYQSESPHDGTLVTSQSPKAPLPSSRGREVESDGGVVAIGSVVVQDL